MSIDPRQVAAVVALPGPRRYRHFISRVADTWQVWGLYRDGWALAKTDDGSLVFPMWPASDYARLCAQYEWQDYEPRAFGLDELMNELLPQLAQDDVSPGIFYTPEDKGVTPTTDQLRADLDTELENYA